MSEREKEILQRMSESLVKTTDAQKEYILGLADGMALANERKPSEDEKE